MGWCKMSRSHGWLDSLWHGIYHINASKALINNPQFTIHGRYKYKPTKYGLVYYCFTNIKILNWPFKIDPARSAPILSHFASRHARLAAQVTPRKARLAPLATRFFGGFPKAFARRRAWRNAFWVRHLWTQGFSWRIRETLLIYPERRWRHRAACVTAKARPEQRFKYIKPQEDRKVDKKPCTKFDKAWLISLIIITG